MNFIFPHIKTLNHFFSCFCFWHNECCNLHKLIFQWLFRMKLLKSRSRRSCSKKKQTRLSKSLLKNKQTLKTFNWDSTQSSCRLDSTLNIYIYYNNVMKNAKTFPCIFINFFSLYFFTKHFVENAQKIKQIRIIWHSNCSVLSKLS